MLTVDTAHTFALPLSLCSPRPLRHTAATLARTIAPHRRHCPDTASRLVGLARYFFSNVFLILGKLGYFR
jgi:hypothetical protein